MNCMAGVNLLLENFLISVHFVNVQPSEKNEEWTFDLFFHSIYAFPVGSMVCNFVVYLNLQSEKDMMLLNRNAYFTRCSLDKPCYFL